MNIEIREDSQYTFEWVHRQNDRPQLINTAKIELQNAAGTTIVPAADMSIVENSATYNIDFAVDLSAGAWSIERNYRAIFTINGAKYVRFFDIVLFPFENPVTDQDVIDENLELRKGQTEERGQADSGDVDLIRDTERIEPNEYWYGGRIDIIPLDDTEQTTSHQITDYDENTHEITFTPPRSVAITTENYVLRRSYQSAIDTAAEIVREDLLKNDKRAYLAIDSSQFKRLIVYKFFERYWQTRRRDQNDQADLQFQHYRESYRAEISSLRLVYDTNEDGATTDDEVGVPLGEIEVIR